MTDVVDERPDEAGARDLGARILEIVVTLMTELHPQRRRVRADLDSDLDRELGFDSLSRVELLLRLERTLGVSLPEQAVTAAETPRDLLRATLAAGSPRVRPAAAPAAAPPSAAAEAVPDRTRTLVEVLDWHAQAQPERTHVHVEEGDTPRAITYAALRDGALARARGLVGRGLEPGGAVALMLPTGTDYLETFLGILLAGGVPVPIYPPARPSQLEDHLRRHAGILDNARATHLVTVAEARTVGRLLRGQVDSLRAVLTPSDLAVGQASFEPAAVRAEDVALLQYTSGSTGQPKGVVLTHANLLANIRAMGDAVAVDSTDVFVSWLPLYHDMGLIGAWLGSLYFAVPLVLMSPLAFLGRPWRWLWAIHRYRGTLSSAPNFAYELCLGKIPDDEIEGLDLASWRVAFNGAEAVSPQTVRRFAERFAPHGFRPSAMTPVYGLAEAAVGLSFPPLGRGPVIERIQRAPFERSGRAVPAADDDAHALEFVACGNPLPGYQIRIVDPAGRELPEREEGRLEFQGPSATSGYWRNPDATARLFDGAWLDSGDLAYVAGGDVFVTGRVKDVVIRGGRNIYPQEVEELVGGLAGIRKGCVAVFPATDPGSGTERMVIVAETRETDRAARDALARVVTGRVADLLGMPPDDVVLAPPRTVPKTSSGKIRRAATRELYEAGGIGREPRAVWWQIARLAVAGIGPRWRRLRRTVAAASYAAWCHGVFWLIAPVAWLAVVVLPVPHWRWAAMRIAARMLLGLGRVPLVVEGTERIPRDRGCVLVANHTSYLDGVALVAALPLEFSFVAKGELRRKPIAHLFLRRIGAAFVERFDKQQGVADARRVTAAAGAGRSLLFFPEGTLTRMPGLLPFHMGAFAAAAEAEAPVVPVAIRGARSILRSGGWFARRGAIVVRVGAPVTAAGRDWQAALELRDAARKDVLRRLGEPDLALERSPI